MNSKILVMAFLLTPCFDCKNVPVRDSGAAHNPAADQNPTRYLLVSESWAEPQTNQRATLTFTYNQQHLVSSLVASQSGPMPKDGSTRTFKMEYSNGFLTRITDKFGESDTLTYNSSGQLVGQEIGPENFESITYSYDAGGNLVGEREVYDSLFTRIYRGFSYDSLGNLLLQTDSMLMGNKLGISKVAYSAYDNKVDFGLTVNGLPPALFTVLTNYSGGFNGQRFGMMSPHNATTVTATLFNPMQPAGVYPLRYTYQYNDAGLPVAYQYGGWSVNLEYRAYK